MPTGPPDRKPVVIRDCRFDGRLGINADWCPVGDVLVVRNDFAFTAPEKSHNFVQVTGTFRNLVIRNNVFAAPDTCYLSFWHLKEMTEAVQVSNNSFVSPTALVFDETVPRRTVRLCNNLFAARGGILVPAGAPSEVVRRWEIGSNTFRERWWGSSSARSLLPLSATDRLADLVEFLSWDAANPVYLRLRADSPLAKAGAGGAWPSYVGALPPGPAPKEGDWFTRLRERWRDVPAGQAPPGQPKRADGSD